MLRKLACLASVWLICCSALAAQSLHAGVQTGGVGPGRGGNTGGGDARDFKRVPYDPKRIYLTREVTRKAVITSRPEPAYTVEARREQVTGTVRLSVVLTAGGKVDKIKVVVGLPSGLSQSAVKAARGIKFIPAQVDGHNVSQLIFIEYNFNLY